MYIDLYNCTMQLIFFKNEYNSYLVHFILDILKITMFNYNTNAYLVHIILYVLFNYYV